jgi:hypothetical protein
MMRRRKQAGVPVKLNRHIPKLFLLIIAVLVLLGLMGSLWWGRGGVAAWPGVGPYRLLEIGEIDGKLETVRLYEFVPELTKGRVLVIPLELTIASYGFPGSYEVRGIYALSKTETGSLALFERSIEEGLGVSIQGLVVRQRQLEEPSILSVQSLFGSLLFRREITLWEWWRLFDLSRTISPDITLLEIETLASITKQTAIDETQYWELYEPAFDVWYERHMPIISTALREFTVTIENTTLKEGRGARIGRIFSHQGFTVLNITDGLAVMSSEILLGEKAMELPELRSVLSAMFPGIPVRDADITGYRSDIVVRIASDW